MHEVKAKARELCEMKDKIVCWTKAALETDKIDIPAAGQVIDMIKDLCEAEKDLYKAKYYCTATEAMLGEEDGDDRMGYDHWRTSSGRYAPKGTGHWTPIHGRKGYPIPADGDWRPEWGPWGDGASGHMMDDGRMGYSDPDWEEYMRDEKHGTPYKQWKLARKHYTETKADGDKREMTEHAKEHMADTVMTIKEIWMAADPDLRTKMKADLTTLINDMK